MSRCLSCSNRYILRNTANRKFTYPLVPGVPTMGTGIKVQYKNIREVLFQYHLDMTLCIQKQYYFTEFRQKQNSGTNGFNKRKLLLLLLLLLLLFLLSLLFSIFS